MEKPEEILRDGFQYPREVTDQDFILGGFRAAPFEVVNESGNWESYLPTPERQRKGGLDTYSCVSFSILNCIETLLKFLEENAIYNFSERFTAIVGGQSRQGADPHKILEGARKKGLLEDYKLPFNEGMNWETYFIPNPMKKEYLKDAKEFLKHWILKHEYIYHPYRNTSLQDKQKLLLKALQRSPVVVSVYAWVKGPKGLYMKPEGVQDTHACLLVGAKEGEHWLIFDSYSPFLKKLDWNFQFDVTKGVYLGVAKKLSFWQRIKNLI